MAANRWFGAVVGDGLRELVDEMVFIGVDPTFDPAAFLAPNVRRLVVVDPQPDIAEALRPLTGADPRVTTIAASIAETSGTATLHVCNHGALSGIRAPIPAPDVFPNARTVDTAVVRTVSVRDLADMLDIDGAQDDPTVRLLALSAPGLTHMAIGELIAGKRLEAFEHLLLQGPVEPLHEGDAPLADTLRLLEKAGYRTVSTFGADPVFPQRRLRRDPLTREAARLSAALNDAETQRDEARTEASGFAARLAEAEAARAATKTQRDAARAEASGLAARLADAEAARATAEAQRDEARTEASGLADRLADRLAEAEAARAAAETQARDGARALIEAQARVAQLEDALDGAERHGRRLDDEMTRAEAQLDLLRQIVTGAAHSR